MCGISLIILIKRGFQGRLKRVQPIRIGISSCLLGENVRYDGGHKLDRFLRDTLKPAKRSDTGQPSGSANSP